MAKKTRELLKGVEVFYTSPLFRAVQTAEIFHEVHSSADFELMTELDKILPADDFLTALENLTCDICAFVGHGPSLPEIIEKLSGNSNFDLEKAGVALLVSDQERKYQLTFLAGPSHFS